MFLFRLAWSLVTAALTLLFLPLRLLGITTTMLWLPFYILLKLFARHTVIFLVILGLIITVFYFRNNHEKMPELTPVQTHTTAAPNGAIPLIEPVLKKEDGDSKFATDLYAAMSEQERIQYSKNYYYAMSAMEDGQVHTWSSYNINGSLRANDTFQNNNGDRCRHFNEVLKVHTIQQTVSGTACEQGGGRWCKLRPNATPMCGLGGSGGFMNSISRSLGNLF